MITMGIVGGGFVGSAISRGFNLFADIRIYDIDQRKRTHSIKETVNSDFVFVCLPTPMESAEGGKCDLSIIENFFDEADALIDRKDPPIFVIKSTVPIGTTVRLNETHSNMKVVHSPEFLTARAALVDFLTPARNIIGAADYSSAANRLAAVCRERFPGVTCYVMTSQESEAVKYIANCFLATKITFFNEMRLLCDAINLDWDKVMEGVLSDGRIAKSHHEVPGHDLQRGFGGTCFPKDINALISTMEKIKLDPKVLKAVWAQNKEIRVDWDWESNSSAVSQVKKDG